MKTKSSGRRCALFNCALPSSQQRPARQNQRFPIGCLGGGGGHLWHGEQSIFGDLVTYAPPQRGVLSALFSSLSRSPSLYLGDSAVFVSLVSTLIWSLYVLPILSPSPQSSSSSRISLLSSFVAVLLATPQHLHSSWSASPLFSTSDPISSIPGTRFACVYLS